MIIWKHGLKQQGNMDNTSDSPSVMQHIPLSLTRDCLLRRMGFGNRNRPPAYEIMVQFELAMDLVKNQGLIYGQAVTLIQKIFKISKKGVVLTNGRLLSGKRIWEIMPHATHIAFAVCTIGKTLETLSKKYVKNDDALMGIVLDGIGSAAVDSLLEEVSHDISKRSAEMGLMSSSPVSPGMPGLPLETQKILFDLLPTEQIAVRLTQHNMIIPFKSSSMIMGIGQEMPKWSKKEVCKSCHLFLHCRYKLE